MLEIIYISARDAFLNVGVWVAFMLLLFGYVEYRTSGWFIRFIKKNHSWQPFIGALFGVFPGCGGAIFVMPLFVTGTVSFGTVIACLIATVGDSSWILITQVPQQALAIHFITFLVGVASGYGVDGLKIGQKLRQGGRGMLKGRQNQREIIPRFQPIEGPEQLALLHTPTHIHLRSTFYRITHLFYPALWGFFLIGFLLAFLTQFNLLTPQEINDSFGGLPIYGIIGFSGTLLCIIWMVLGKKTLRDDTHEELEQKLQSLREMLIHNGQETAFVTVWVMIAYFLFHLLIMVTGIELSRIVSQAGFMAVLAGAAVGLIPGCGPQILLMTLYTQGALPLPVAIANAISQDGDALFPLLALHRKSAFYATLVTTVPAIIVGLLVYSLI